MLVELHTCTHTHTHSEAPKRGKKGGEGAFTTGKTSKDKYLVPYSHCTFLSSPTGVFSVAFLIGYEHAEKKPRRQSDPKQAERNTLAKKATACMASPGLAVQ